MKQHYTSAPADSPVESGLEHSVKDDPLIGPGREQRDPFLAAMGERGGCCAHDAG